MRKLYDKRPVLFAVLWIVVYCVVMTSVKGSRVESRLMFPLLMTFAVGIAEFVRVNDLEENCGVAEWPKDTRRYLYFIPMWILATGNLWDGFAPTSRGVGPFLDALSMLLVGYVEEMLFRGFLFRAMLSKGRAVTAIVVSSLTFGMGHIVNLLAGQAFLATVGQMVFAVVWGFLLTMVFYKSGSLLPCILAHAMIDAFSLYGADDPLGDWIYIGTTIVVGTLYCLYLCRLKTEENANGRK